MSETMKALTLGLQGELFAIEASCVWEILDVVPITHVPTAPAFADGLINVRGRVVPLADLRAAFGMERKPPGADARIVVVEIEIDGRREMAGILADKVFDVADLDSSNMEDAPNVGMRWRKDFIRAIAKRRDEFIVVPDLDRIFAVCCYAQDTPASQERIVS
jgi:purine-binding chemotaxis protein CheW